MGLVSTADQFLFGYDNGHRLLNGSCALSAELLVRLLGATDAAMSPDCPPLVTGIALPETTQFGFCVTWSAPELPRAGAVWAHAIVVDAEQLRDGDAVEALFRLPRRPLACSLAGYAEPLELDVRRAPLASYLPTGVPSAELLRTLASAAYHGRADPVVVHDDLGEAALALLFLWAAQWPELRSNFSFRTREVASFERPGGGITVAARLRGHGSAPMPRDDDAPAPWLEAIVEDARSPTPTPLGEFLWEFGPHEPPEPRRLRRLASLWTRVAAGDIRRARKQLERHWPAGCGTELKRALFGPSDSSWWGVGEPEQIGALADGDGAAWDTDGLAAAD
jgi:hypothetical protein